MRCGVQDVLRACAKAIVAFPGARPIVRKLAQAGLIPRVVWRHLPPTPVVKFAIEGVNLSCALPDTDGVARELDWVGLSGDEAATIRVVARYAARPGVVVDVGANVGLYSLVAALFSEEAVRSYEPVPRTFTALLANLERNALGGSVIATCAAVGVASGRAAFHVPFGESPSSASLGPAGFRGLDGEVIDVAVVTLDEELADVEAIALVKVDVEGFEHLVLEGMQSVLQTHGPPIILESNHDGPFLEVEAKLQSQGYGFKQLRPEGPVVVESLRTAPNERFRNFLCEPLFREGRR